jgi:FKBP-type peptidyl-prolyl cis-trans isomerase
MQKVIIGALCALTFFSCDNSDRKVGEKVEKENGFKYEYVRLGEGEASSDSSRWIVANIKVVTQSDSVLFETNDMMPAGLPVYDAKMRGMFAEGIEMLREGDSAVFYIPADNFFSQTYQMPVPFGIDKEQDLKVFIGVRKMTTQTGYQDEMQAKARDAQRQQIASQSAEIEKDRQQIRSYLAENEMEADSTEFGVYIVKTEDAEGTNASLGDTLQVKYSGHVLGRDEDFDAGTFPLVLGKTGVIWGWTEGLQKFSEGDKGTMYIPSQLGYGPRAQGDVIPANSILVFDIEILGVNKPLAN